MPAKPNYSKHAIARNVEALGDDLYKLQLLGLALLALGPSTGFPNALRDALGPFRGDYRDAADNSTAYELLQRPGAGQVRAVVLDALAAVRNKAHNRSVDCLLQCLDRMPDGMPTPPTRTEVAELIDVAIDVWDMHPVYRITEIGGIKRELPRRPKIVGTLHRDEDEKMTDAHESKDTTSDTKAAPVPTGPASVDGMFAQTRELRGRMQRAYDSEWAKSLAVKEAAPSKTCYFADGDWRPVIIPTVCTSRLHDKAVGLRR